MPRRHARKNTPQLWDEVWSDGAAPDDDRHALAKERVGVRFRRITQRVVERFGGFENLDVIEIGAGIGTNAALFASLGSNVTLLDYSDKALERGRSFFERNGLSATQIHADALRLPDELIGGFDVSMSFGLAEHFIGEPRVEVVRSHLELLKPGGLTFVSVPNRANPPYRVYKALASRTRLWNVGEEYPFSRDELESICSTLGVKEFSFFGDSVLDSFRFVNPVAATRRLLGKKTRIGGRPPRSQRPTRFDDRYAYALVLCAAR
jgi:2-polyprenyl-3-methyl-5-hydroxy-6-metoxy-1,4-benzoquinol methylase